MLSGHKRVHSAICGTFVFGGIQTFHPGRTAQIRGKRLGILKAANRFSARGKNE